MIFFYHDAQLLVRSLQLSEGRSRIHVKQLCDGFLEPSIYSEVPILHWLARLRCKDLFCTSFVTIESRILAMTLFKVKIPTLISANGL